MRFHVKSSSYHHQACTMSATPVLMYCAYYAYYVCTMPVLCLFTTTATAFLFLPGSVLSQIELQLKCDRFAFFKTCYFKLGTIVSWLCKQKNCSPLVLILYGLPSYTFVM